MGSINRLKTVNYTISLYLDGIPLGFVDSYTYLGITLDKHVSLKCLLSGVKKKMYQFIYLDDVKYANISL